MMSEFAFCCKNDSKRESISKFKCKDMNEAIEYFAGLKNLDVESFLEVFKVYMVKN